MLPLTYLLVRSVAKDRLFRAQTTNDGKGMLP